MKKLVIILGMRSGTSLTARISQCMGAYLGEADELMGAGPGNPDGHYENLEVVRINDNILHLCDKEWYSLETPIPDRSSLQMKKEMEAIKSVVRKLFKKSDTVVIKDPRISVLLPLWGEVLKDLEIDVNYIWVFRNPLEVMESLKKRDGHGSRHTLLMWIHHNFNILKYLRGKEYLLVNYKDILRQADVLEKISRLLDCKFDEKLKWELSHIIKQGYCHSEYSRQDVRNTGIRLLADLYDVLSENREATVDIPDWENCYKTTVTQVEPTFIDYDAVEDIRCLDGKEIVIYGAGNYGRCAAEMLQQLGFPKYIFCDKDIHKQGMNLMNGKVVSIADIECKKNQLLIVAIENEKIRKEVVQILSYIEGITFLSFFALQEAYKYSFNGFTTLFFRAERLREWYKELVNRADSVMKACKNPVLVYQNGKVGSSSVSRSLQEAGIDNAHVHRFFFKRDIVGELILGEDQNEFIQNSNFLNTHSSEYMKAVKEEMRNKKIITMVREPVAVDLSTVFQWIGTGTTDRFFMERIREGKSYIQVIFELMEMIQDRQFEWFHDELEELCGIDVYAYPFDKEKGFSVISKDGTEVLLLRAEELSNLTDVIRDFSGGQEFELLNENEGRNKAYSHLYNAVKEKIRLSKEYVEHYYYNNPYMDHFYSKEQKGSFLEKWRANIREE